MRSLIVIAMLLGPNGGLALAEVARVPSLAPLPPSQEAIAKQARLHQEAVADCEQMWDRGTHMSRREWSQTCRRVQNRLQQLQTK